MSWRRKDGQQVDKARLMRVLRTVVEIAVLAMLHPREDCPLRRPVAFELVGDDHVGHVGEPLEEFAQFWL